MVSFEEDACYEVKVENCPTHLNEALDCFDRPH
jgi:hypothetical protein